MLAQAYRRSLSHLACMPHETRQAASLRQISGGLSWLIDLSQRMADERKSWLRRRTEEAVRSGLTRAYETVRVDPERFLFQLRAAYGLPIVTFQGVYSVELSRLDDVAESVIRSGMKMAAVEGAG